jgi:hypothetical protein
MTTAPQSPARPTTRTPAERRAHVMRVAERVLAEVYRHATRAEMIDSQLRVREAVVREIARRRP